MSYTPAFQKVLDKTAEIYETNPEEAGKYFQEQCKLLGPYERLNNLYKVRPKRPVPGQTSRLVFFRCNKVQDLFWKNKSNRDLVVKSRQQGITTFSLLIALDKCIWEEGVHTAIMAHVKDNLKGFFRIVKTAFTEFQRDWGHLYQVSTKYDNVNELTIKETGSALKVCTETKGLTLDFLHISEAAFVEDSRISESMESVPLSGWIVLESTPDTTSGMYYEIFDQVDTGKNSAYKVHFFPWFLTYPEDEDVPFLKPNKDLVMNAAEQELVNAFELTPEHIVWRRIKLGECSNDLGEFHRKYPIDARSAFMAGSSSIFPPALREGLWKNQRDPAFIGDLSLEGTRVKFKNMPPPKDEGFGLRIWEQPKPTGQYVIGADVSEGVAKDASAYQVVNIKTGAQAAVYMNRGIDADTFAAELYKAGIYWNKAYLNVEANSVGLAVIAHLTAATGGLNYPKLYKRIVFDEIKQKKTKIVGFKTTSLTKPRIIENLKAALRDGDLILHDRYTLTQLGNFTRDNETGRLGAKGNAVDDLVMALAIMWEQARILKETMSYKTEYSNFQPQFDPSTGFPL